MWNCDSHFTGKLDHRACDHIQFERTLHFDVLKRACSVRTGARRSCHVLLHCDVQVRAQRVCDGGSFFYDCARELCRVWVLDNLLSDV